MTEPTINLQKDLELWCDMDAQSFDQQRNQMQDKSGYGRHPTASGGPTIGVEGPDNFGATSLDGSNDYFNVGDPLPIPGTQSGFALIKIDDLSINGGISGNENTSNFDDGYRFRTSSSNNGEIEVQFADGSGNRVEIRWTDPETNIWYSVVWRYTGSEIQLFVDNELKSQANVSTHTTGTQNIHIGEWNTQYFPGDIVVSGRWSRALSDAEIKQLNRLTAPRRSNL